MAWKLKLTEDGHAETRDGVAVYVDDDGTETTIDPNQLHAKLMSVNGESKSRRERLQQLEARLEPVKDIEDLTAYVTQAKRALDLTKNLDDAKLVQAGEVEKIKSEAVKGLAQQEEKLRKQFMTREEELQGQIKDLDLSLRKLLISARFAQHPLFAGPDPRTFISPDMAEARFGANFEVRDANGSKQVVGRDFNGDVILSRDPKRFGEPADFDEAMELLFAAYPGKDQVLRAGLPGSGGKGGQAGVGKPTPAAEIKRKLAEAQKAGDAELAVKLKTRLHELIKSGG